MCKMCHRDVQVAPPAPAAAAAAAPAAATPAAAPKRPPLMFNQLRGLKMKHNLSTDPHSESMQRSVAYQPDLLAVSTQYSRVIFEAAGSLYRSFQETSAYTVLTRTTQPLHVLLALLVTCTWLASRGSTGAGALRLWKALYAAGIAVHIGAQVWMTLISGIVLYFSIPRHEFGRVQEVLFPVYFAFNAMVSFVTLLAYVRIQFISQFLSISWLQIALLLATFLIESSVRLYFVHPMLKMKHLKTQMEESAHGGKEVGKLVLGELAHCPHYMRILRAFRAHHSKVAMGNLITLGCSVYSLMILVDSICIA